MANEQKTVYLPRMRTRPGFTHSYQSSKDIKVVAVDADKAKADARAANRRSRPVRGGNAEDEA